MRIIAGKWRGRTIVAPKGEITRPTADRTRERLFSMLTSRLGDFEDLQILDLFSGSGALGLEALSRGAAHCTFVEQDRDAIRALEKNIEKLDAGAVSDVRIGSVLHLGQARKPYDLILMDPPYDSGAGAVALDKLGRHGWFAPSSWIAVETGRDEEVVVKGFGLDIMRNSSKARLHILRPETD
ncbi:16S rRNA (guanine(966)-N(2))-methyltransferase RsmD [Parasphingorhabdus flavimaris]|jgi:16S rRNA (guanine966-N2)-methyltransferase|uniref:16S rRNA (Guanine(966)-N(2))-methyltransferase RsmD n=1 Tax=Parasphingorhabdus flavimaris TaxID=266812 RepID=A0ABX2N119_9SPHN|nr:16S rRNA (guanine(966)-N(2))-methyltransferase RsmD [Parasphingorhabdus flavimaris]NVD27422.1 16S rRNA (guanine(966)-N(2))-methyltransferase RsmD [Parasphingorhabdus flavimaris]|tara:strand:+ start:4790 stop:5338 length:549 start_codon:yes stop_codon:yes gene_type:complete